MTDQVSFKLVLIRHGDSVWSVENKFCGWHDADLSQKGLEDAKRAAIVILIPFHVLHNNFIFSFFFK